MVNLGSLLPSSVPEAPSDADLKHSASGGARWIFLSAPKLNEPVMQYRSFVMSTADDIAETERLIASGEFGQ